MTNDTLNTVQALVESARLLGVTQAKKGFGCYTEQDSRFEVAMHKSISSHTNALIEQMQRMEQAVPQGYKLAPLEPTLEMMARGANCQEYAHDDIYESSAAVVYKAMLAASPAAATPVQPIAQQEPVGYVSWHRLRDLQAGRELAITLVAQSEADLEPGGDVPLYASPALSDEVCALLDGIDRTQTEKPEGGWWETSTGAEFGAAKLTALLSILARAGITRRESNCED